MRTKERSTAGLGKAPLSIWKVSGRPVTIDEFIEAGRDRVDAREFRTALRSLSDRLRERLKSVQSEEYPDLKDAVLLIIRVLESPEAFRAREPLPRWLSEVGFGARYLLKRFDLIDDHLPEIGLADDAQLLTRILERNSLALSR